MKKIIYFTLLTAIITITFGCEMGRGEKEPNVVYDSIETGHSIPDTKVILSKIKSSADLVTTEVTIKKVAIYDSNKNEKFRWTDPSSWKYGEQKCIVPITVKLKYGYDLSQLTFDNIKISDDSTAVVIYLPKPKIIDAGYNAEIKEGSSIKISTGLRSQIGHELEEEIRQKGYQAVLKEDIQSIVGDDIERNAKTIFESIVKSLGIDYVQIVTTKK